MNDKLFRDDLITVDGVELYPIPNHAGYYADFEKGKVFNTQTEKYLGLNSQGSKRTGYVYVSMKDDDGNISTMSEHWAVYSAYTGIPKDVYIRNGLTLHHINGNKSDNSIFNLIPVRHKDQYQDADTKQRLKNRSPKRLTTEDKYNMEISWQVYEGKRSEFVNEFAELLGVHWRTVDNYVKDNLLD